MIARISKVEIVGPKGMLQDVLSLLRDAGVLQIEPTIVGFIERGDEEHIRSFLPDEKTLSERLFLEDLKLKIDKLFSYLPKMPVRTSYIDPLSILDTIAKTVDRHASHCKELYERKDAVEKERAELSRYRLFMDTLASLLDNVEETPDLEFIGLTIKEPDMVGHVRELLSYITDWKFELVTEAIEDGTLVGLITVERGISEKVKKSLSDEHIPELTFPSSFGSLPFPEKIAFVRKKVALLSEENERIAGEVERFARRWIPIYANVREWTEERLSLLRTTASVFETRMCFFISGWIPSGELEILSKKVKDSFQGKVEIEEKGIFEEDLDRVPIILKNPPYFKPFELLVRFLPLPRYTSFDPTPFIGIFFPIFFGMILGDAGYGVILASLSAVMMKRFKKKKDISDALKILFISSIYAIFFGILYGEFFGELGHKLFGLEPIYIERRAAIAPMILFSLSIGVVHVILGLTMGVISALKKRSRKEALYKFLTIFIIVCIVVIIASFIGLFPGLLTRPMVIGILVLAPFLLFAGGLLAPLEVLKSIGNIISYVRIMAIGLTSVLLAFVANNLAGMTGDIVTGVIVAGLLHILNIVLGVFSPAVHSLRLHYVEFFSKFLEPGGRRFEPLRR